MIVHTLFFCCSGFCQYVCYGNSGNHKAKSSGEKTNEKKKNPPLVDEFQLISLNRKKSDIEATIPLLWM